MVQNDFIAQEKKAGQKAARKLRTDLRAVLSTATVRQTGTLLKKTGARLRMKHGELHAISINTPQYTFIQHYGFEGIKKNGARMKMKAYNHFGNLYNRTNALDELADTLGSIRADEVTTNIRF